MKETRSSAGITLTGHRHLRPGWCADSAHSSMSTPVPYRDSQASIVEAMAVEDDAKRLGAEVGEFDVRAGITFTCKTSRDVGVNSTTMGIGRVHCDSQTSGLVTNRGDAVYGRLVCDKAARAASFMHCSGGLITDHGIRDQSKSSGSRLPPDLVSFEGPGLSSGLYAYRENMTSQNGRSFIRDVTPQPQERNTRRLASRRANQTQSFRITSRTRRTNESDQGKNRQYCTHKCLQGLLRRGPLDHKCPNVKAHGRHSHRIDRSAFLRLMHKQLSMDLDHDVDCLRIHGSRGVLFRVCLTSHGEFVPVHLGNIDLTHAPVLLYYGIAELTHMMFRSFGGVKVSREILSNHSAEIHKQVERAVSSIHDLEVLHRDLIPRNILWNAAGRQAVIIDFERARFPAPRLPLGELSPNRKRKRLLIKKMTCANSSSPEFDQEKRNAVRALGVA
ncbi:hypothetical protein EJ05DRAFT_490761 [Pseudovirgaria hyperparasitica]|uniref:Protein kinase domain-containing protein n=1 Tax=Pseudovirgaria hyperparasitica TaxID=470096 RepID=A0A6A6VQZ7_9PEZI|nr:uncharacterized protein EJ05DRAFT_490761 [Pseudovirgaria hyperparasitica]KAF2752623.1 hypothetical protein EJ05DRAFT_490761 [Pseudovirgaria hyperparasitica]